MKIGFTGLDLPEGKVKYQDEHLAALQAKDNPKKVSPFFAEFIRGEFVHVDAVAVAPDKLLDILILDMEKIETRLGRLAEGAAAEAAEKELLQKCLAAVEAETPLCDVSFSEEAKKLLRAAALPSFKPVVRLAPETDPNTVIARVLEKSGLMFFYTTGPKESHAWLVPKDTDIVTCAAKIHSDLARGFIKGDVVSFTDYMECHSFNDCRSKGRVRMVDRDYAVQPNEIIEIRFNV